MTDEDSYEVEYTVEVTGDEWTQEQFRAVVADTTIPGSPEIVEQTQVNEDAVEYDIVVNDDEWAQEQFRMKIVSAPGEVQISEQTDVDGNVFEDTLRGEVKVKNIPNAEFSEGTFKFEDFFDIEGFLESFTGEVDDEAELVKGVFAPYDGLTGTPEITVSEDVGEMYWRTVEVEIPATRKRQRVLAELIAESWKTRKAVPESL